MLSALAVITVIEEVAAAEPVVAAAIGGLIGMLKSSVSGPQPTAEQIAAVRAEAQLDDAEFDSDLPRA